MPRSVVCALGVVLLLTASPIVPLHALQPPPDQPIQSPIPVPTELSVSPGGLAEVRLALVRLPFAALLGAALALRPRRRSQGPRTVVVVQTQIMLAVVGAVIMLIVGNSLSRAFGIVGAAGLIRYRSDIADPKDAVVMLASLAAGLAVGVGLYWLAPVATLCMVAILWIVEYFEPPARRRFELKASTKEAAEFRPKLESVLTGLGLEFELLLEEDEELRYIVSAPVEVHTRDVSDTLRLVGGSDVVIKWAEKKSIK